uniref:Uncharacterized protein n=1 Tax=Strongyloides papillosus TaxID=174720 RepID=A0A0N5BH22_STREA
MKRSIPEEIVDTISINEVVDNNHASRVRTLHKIATQMRLKKEREMKKRAIAFTESGSRKRKTTEMDPIHSKKERAEKNLFNLSLTTSSSQPPISQETKENRNVSPSQLDTTIKAIDYMFSRNVN